MKNFYLLIFTLFFFSQSFGQGILSETGGKLYIGASAGPSFPVGDYGDADAGSNKSGYATTGYKVEVSAGVRLFNILELTVMGFRNVNGTDPENLKTYLTDLNPAANFNVESDDWIINGGMGGIGISYPLPNHFIADIRVLGGYMDITSPKFYFTTANPGVYYKIESATTSSFVYLTSVSVRYPVISRIYVSLGFDYLGSSADFNDVKTIRSFEGNVVETTQSFEQSLDTWAFTAGIKLFVL
jgi:hypothetical protein